MLRPAQVVSTLVQRVGAFEPELESWRRVVAGYSLRAPGWPMRTTQPQVLLARLLERLALPLERPAGMLTAAELAQPVAKQIELLP